MGKTNETIKKDLTLAYERVVEQRDGYRVAPYKAAERARFLQLLRDEDKNQLIDLGSGPGTHAIYFQNYGIQVTCIDLSSGNITKCKDKGLEGFVCDVMGVESLGLMFDCAFAMNSLLHIPSNKLPESLAAISAVLSPGGLFYWGQYGGVKSEGVFEEDSYVPKRFFSLLEDDQIFDQAARVFDVLDYQNIELEDEPTLHHQSFILRVPQGR